VIAVASIVGMAVTTGLGVSALIARQQAERAQQEAVQRREQAEDLLAFMVGDLRESLEPLGRLDLLDRVGDKAMDYFKSVEADAISDRSLTLQSQVLTQIGEIRMSQYQYQQASRAFEEAYRHVEPLVLRYPGDGEMLFQRSQAEFWVGYMRWRTGDLDGAQQWLQRYYESSLELTGLDPSRDDWLQEVAWGHHNLGVLAVDQKHLGRARELFANERAVWKDLLDRSPGDQDIPENIADAYSWLGRISEYEGDLQEALFNYGESARYRAELLAASPDHAGHKQWSVVAQAFVAGTRALMGQVREAAAAYSELLAAQTELAEADPENRELQRYLARMQVDSAELAVSAETEAERSRGWVVVENAIATLERFLRAEPEDRRSRVALAKAYRVEAMLSLLRERNGAALESALEAVALLAEQLDDVRANQEFGAALAVALAAGAAETANSSGHGLAEHLANFKRNAEGSRDPRTLDALARVAIRGGDTNRAVEIIGQLERSGYVPMHAWPASPR
jgi:serine/threonine-protein kinase